VNNLKKYFIAGLVVVIPVALTFYIFFVVFQFIDNILGSFLTGYLKSAWGFYIPGIGFMFCILLILLVGILATRFLKHRIFMDFERWFSGLPLIKSIYPALKQVILFVSAQKEFGFKKVVLVEYPCRGIWSMGFITNEGFAKLNQATGKDMLAVFLPMSPGPLSGYVVFIPKEEVKFLDMAVNEALNIIISGGVFSPKN
jgi:uncharacterized membrane protein